MLVQDTPPGVTHSVDFLEQTLYSLFSTGSTQEDKKASQHDWKIVDRNAKHQYKHTNSFDRRNKS